MPKRPGVMGLSSSAQIIVLSVSLVLGANGVNSAGTCRQDPYAQSHFCGLPYYVSNFQGTYYQQLYITRLRKRNNRTGCSLSCMAM